MSDDLSIGKLFVELVVNDAKYGPALKQAAADVDALRAKVKTSTDQAAASVAPLAAAYVKVSEAEKQHIATIIASTAAEKARAAELSITVAQLRQVEAALASAAAANKAVTTTTTSATAAMKKQGAAIADVGVSANSAQAAAGNLRFQLFDIVQQASAGQNPLMILNQQGFQVAQAFGSGPSGAGGALATFTAALGPLGPAFTAATAAAGPLLIALAALGTAYTVWANATMDIESTTTGAADASVAAAKRIAGTAADMAKANEAWEKFRDTTEDISIQLAVADGSLSKTEAKTIERARKVREEAEAGIRSAGRQLAATQVQLQAMQRLYDSDASAVERAEASKNMVVLRQQEAEQQKLLDDRKAALGDTIDLVTKLGVAEQKAEEDKGGKKAKAQATKDQTAALREYEAAMRDLAKTTDDAADAAALQAAENRGGDSPVERTFERSMEKARQQTQKALDDSEKALAEAVAASVKIGGELGASMAESAKAAFAQARGAILGEFVAAQNDAEAIADKATRDSALKRVRADEASVQIRVATEEEYANTLAEIRAEYVERYGELVRVEIDYARLSADERLAVEQKIQGEMESLRERAAEAEQARQQQAAKASESVAKDIFGMAKQTADQLYDYETGKLQDTNDALEADADARAKRSEGQTLTAAEQAAILTTAEKNELEVRKRQQQEAVTAAFYLQQGFAVASIALNTAQAVMQVLATLPAPASFVAAAVVAGLGAAQAGIALDQKPPEFHVGGVVDEEDRRVSPGRSTGRAVTTELEVGEGVLVSRAVQALGGREGLARLNVDPMGAISQIAMRIDPATGVSRTAATRPDARILTAPLPISQFYRGPTPDGQAVAGRAPDRPIVVVSKIGERTFDTIMADGIGGRNLPRVRQRLQRMAGVTAGLEG